MKIVPRACHPRDERDPRNAIVPAEVATLKGSFVALPSATCSIHPEPEGSSGPSPAPKLPRGDSKGTDRIHTRCVRPSLPLPHLGYPFGLTRATGNETSGGLHRRSPPSSHRREASRAPLPRLHAMNIATACGANANVGLGAKVRNERDLEGSVVSEHGRTSRSALRITSRPVRCRNRRLGQARCVRSSWIAAATELAGSAAD